MVARCRAFLVGVVLSSLLMGPAAAGPYENGLAAYSRGDYATAYRLWHPLAEQGNALAQSNLGAMYAKGEGVPKDDREAVRWFLLAAEQGNALAQTNLGTMYAKGEGVPKDDGEAVRWYRLAAEQGVAEAQLNLGLMYAKGEGVPKDYVRAYMWWNLAAAQGVEDATKFREDLTQVMTAAQIAEAQAQSGNWNPRK